MCFPVCPLAILALQVTVVSTGGCSIENTYAVHDTLATGASSEKAWKARITAGSAVLFQMVCATVVLETVRARNGVGLGNLEMIVIEARGIPEHCPVREEFHGHYGTSCGCHGEIAREDK
ncbi:hypothetical protein BV25DRAFT_1829167 [Artomyces pyxidatus]|uniref:Uncharacterized protein n=1 Tax=Artomyces pyxidatus TaxID=48021 RepID=A0ACB8SSL5_9AGAM|nr:hypothetical protein BV25DRAFT_1829167 [Artomyces pyxidatus]